MAARASKPATLPRPKAGGDVDEAAAIACAVEALRAHADNRNATAVATAVISAWIVERTRLQTAGRLTEHVVFNLGEAHLTGMVTACLPQIGGTLAEAGFDFAKSFGDLTKAEAVSLFLAGCVAYREAAIRKGESPGFPFDEAFDDAVPFGGPLVDGEVPF